MSALFPVPLVCPSCAAPLAPAPCACPAATRVESWNGMPRVLFGQPYQGEFPRAILAEILRLTDARNWRGALEEAAAGDPSAAALTCMIGPDFVHGLAWNEIETVLDVGSGLGFMTSWLAERAKTVVAAEATPERALFQRKRAAQDGVKNWHPVVAGPEALPFPSGTFELVTLGGPDKLSPSFLAEVLRVLKPGGYFYAGIDAGLGPRRAPRLAGFGRAELLGFFDARDHQRGVYPLNSAGPRRAVRELLDPPASWKGRITRSLGRAGSRLGLVKDDAAFLARKGDAPGRLHWAALPHEGEVAQFSSADKVFALCLGAEPVVYKGPKTAEAVPLLEKEHALLSEASRRHGAESESWPLRWPKAFGGLDLHGRRFFKYEFARGTALATELLPASFTLERFGRIFSRFVDGYVDLSAKLTLAPAASGALLDSLAAVSTGDAECDARVKEACAAARRKGWTAGFMHGDLSFGNTLLRANGAMILVDWENSEAGGLPALDLIRLLSDVRDESRLLKPAARRAARAAARRIVRGALERFGLGRGDDGDVEALFVAHQFRMWLVRDPAARESKRARRLLRAWRERDFSAAD